MSGCYGWLKLFPSKKSLFQPTRFVGYEDALKGYDSYDMVDDFVVEEARTCTAPSPLTQDWLRDLVTPFLLVREQARLAGVCEELWCDIRAATKQSDSTSLSTLQGKVTGEGYVLAEALLVMQRKNEPRVGGSHRWNFEGFKGVAEATSSAGLIESLETSWLRAAAAQENNILFEDWKGSWWNRQWKLGPGLAELPQTEICKERYSHSTRSRHRRTFLRLTNLDIMTNMGPTGLWRSWSPWQPTNLRVSLHLNAHKANRGGAVVALAGGLGNDKGPEDTAVMLYLRSVKGCGNDKFDGLKTELCFGEQLCIPIPNEWIDIAVRLDWESKSVVLTVEGCEYHEPFINVRCEAVRVIMLYNHTCDCEAEYANLFVS